MSHVETPDLSNVEGEDIRLTPCDGRTKAQRAQSCNWCKTETARPEVGHYPNGGPREVARDLRARSVNEA
jgi:hypothetical protein